MTCTKPVGLYKTGFVSYRYGAESPLLRRDGNPRKSYFLKHSRLAPPWRKRISSIERRGRTDGLIKRELQPEENFFSRVDSEYSISDNRSVIPRVTRQDFGSRVTKRGLSRVGLFFSDWLYGTILFVH